MNPITRLLAVMDMYEAGLLCDCIAASALGDDDSEPVPHHPDCTGSGKVVDLLNAPGGSEADDYDIKSAAAGGDGDLL